MHIWRTPLTDLGWARNLNDDAIKDGVGATRLLPP